jgi:hypothetical protein
VNPVRDDVATILCEYCNASFDRQGRAIYCSTVCRQRAWRVHHDAPVEIKTKKAATVYECAVCDNRYLGEQRCGECNVWCAKVGPGGSCPTCDEPVAMSDLFTIEQMRR